MQPNKILEYSAYAVGGVALFLASLLVFALAAGVPAHQVALVGGLFPEPAAPATGAPEGGDATPARPKVQTKSFENVIAATLARIPGQAQASPFASDELESLVGDLKRLKLQYEEQLEKVTTRATDIEEREAVLQERSLLLQDLMAQLDLREGEIDLKQAELARDEVAAADGEVERWKKIAQAFKDGEPVALSKRLLAYGAEEGAHILVNLDDDQRTALLGALSDKDFKDFNDAYSALGD